MDFLYVEGDRTSKRARLNQSAVLYYGTRDPLVNMNNKQKSTPSPVLLRSTRHKERMASTRLQQPAADCSDSTVKNITKQIKFVSKELLKLRHETQSRFPRSTGEVRVRIESLELICEKLASMQEDVRNLKFARGHEHSGYSKGQSSELIEAEKRLFNKAEEAIEDIQTTLESIIAENRLASCSRRRSSSRSSRRHRRQHSSCEIQANSLPSISNNTVSFAKCRTRGPSPATSISSISSAASSIAANLESIKSHVKNITISEGRKKTAFRPPIFGTPIHANPTFGHSVYEKRRRLQTMFRKRKLSDDENDPNTVNDYISYQRVTLRAKRLLEMPQPMDCTF